MIIYGHRSAHLGSSKPNHLECPNCNTKGSTEIHVFRRHAHVFWIPLFPMGRYGVSECSHCKQVYEKKEMSSDIRAEYDIASMDAKGPIWQFAGLVIIALLAIGAYFVGEQNKEDNLAKLNTPEVGDIYECEYGEGFSTFRIEAVEADSLLIVENDYETDEKSGIDDINLPENYSTLVYKISRSDLAGRFERDEILDINR